MRRFVASFLSACILSAALAHVARATDAPAYTWSGFYVGGQVGGGWENNAATIITGSPSFPAGTIAASRQSGVLGGVYGGYSYQINRLVIGIDADYSFANVTGAATFAAPAGPAGVTSSSNYKANEIASLSARFGYAANNWLFFGKLGGAWERFAVNGAATDPAGVPTTLHSSVENRYGGLIGIGAEFGFMPNWSVKLEYDYVKFATNNFNQTNTTIATGAVSMSPDSTTSNISMVKLGVAYRF